MKENTNNKKRISLKSHQIQMERRNKNSSSKLSNQYAKIKNAVKGRKKFKMIQTIIMDLLLNSLKKL
jgi:hypothetical protein